MLNHPKFKQIRHELQGNYHLNLPILPCSAGKSYVFVGH